MRIAVQITYKRPVPLLTSEMKAAIRANIEDAVKETDEEIKASMREPKSGRFYRRKGGRIHQASAPGESPAVDTGKLIKSLQTEIAPNGMLGANFTHSEYAEPLEFGSVKMEPRPFMRPAVKKVKPKFFAKMKRVLPNE